MSPAHAPAIRRNAQYSTGSRTATGKQAVKWNVLKHGLLSKEVVILAGDGKESKAEYRTLHAQLQEYYQPVGIAEELLVEQIAAGYWRLRRVVRCETGEIRGRVDTVTWRTAAAQEKEVQQHVCYGHRDALPSAPATEKILRYETAIQRQLTQAMNQLERLQQTRKGHAVPPPISVAVSQ